MAEDIRISVDTARFRRPTARGQRARFSLLREAALPLIILGLALVIFVAV
jgi:hypothetical protein